MAKDPVELDELKRHWAATFEVAKQMTPNEIMAALRQFLDEQEARFAKFANVTPHQRYHADLRRKLQYLWTGASYEYPELWSFTNHHEAAATAMRNALDKRLHPGLDAALEIDCRNEGGKRRELLLAKRTLAIAHNRRVRHWRGDAATEMARFFQVLWSAAETLFWTRNKENAGGKFRRNFALRFPHLVRYMDDSKLTNEQLGGYVMRWVDEEKSEGSKWAELHALTKKLRVEATKDHESLRRMSSSYLRGTRAEPMLPVVEHWWRMRNEYVGAVAIHRMYGLEACALGWSTIREPRAAGVFECQVHVFSVRHPASKRCYTWSYEDAPGQWRTHAVLKTRQADKPATVVRQWLATKSERTKTPPAAQARTGS